MTASAFNSQPLELFHLTDEQWALLQPLLVPAASARRVPPSPPPGPPPPGRPPIDERRVLEAILWKITNQAAWYDLPAASAVTPAAPSWQTCYRYYRRWQRLGLFPEIIRLLYLDLRDRGGLDLIPMFLDGRLSLDKTPAGWRLVNPAGWDQPWHRAVARLFAALILTRLKKSPRLRPYSLIP
ncbi:MAG: hypothetical protein A2W35_08550 [Chloroflexi bacterium RBG_16_57_11]|nr:MAG: hypothetical protein A2W35_08550 [Chloroflexi bacterium RBG_16_57_11]